MRTDFHIGFNSNVRLQWLNSDVRAMVASIFTVRENVKSQNR